MDHALSRTQFVRWRTAIFAIFFVAGLGFSSWAARLPAVKISLGLNDTHVGSLLFAMGAASLVGLSLANVAIARWGARNSMYASITIFALGLVFAGLGVQFIGSFPVTTVGLVFIGLGLSATDIMMNVEAAAVERAAKRTLMPLFHAFFSFGTVAGAAIGIAMAAWGVGVGWHLGAIAVVLFGTGMVCLANVPRRDTTADTPETSRRERVENLLAVWKQPRIYAIGIIMLGMAFAEGGATDWLAIAMVDGHRQSEAIGAVALTVFSTAMTVFRIIGGPIVDRVGRVWTLRALSVLAVAGLVMFILAPNLPVAFIGIALWGAGASMGFPLGMSAAADDPHRAAAAVSAAATIGYVAFLAGPPVLGWVSNQIGILPTLWIIVVLIALSGSFSSAAKPPAGSTLGAGRH